MASLVQIVKGTNCMEIPQVVANTGISADYMNEYTGKKAVLQAERTAFGEFLREFPVKGYTERFPTQQYKDTVTDQNRERVEALDQIAYEANQRFSDPDQFTDEEFYKTLDQVRVLVYGNLERRHALREE